MKHRKRRRRTKLSAEEKAKRRQQHKLRKRIVSAFTKSGFVRIPSRNRKIMFGSRQSELDDIFVYKNIVVITEDTCLSSSDDVREHLLKKSLLYKDIVSRPSEFIDTLNNYFPTLQKQLQPKYQSSDIILKILYCSATRLEERHKADFSYITFLEERPLQYFEALSRVLGRSARFEFFKYFNIRQKDICQPPSRNIVSYEAFALPDSPSGFPGGFRLFTFYIDPETLMRLGFVLRKDGWLDSGGLYQRMISRRKILNMRRFLGEQQRVFINNIIVSLPSECRLRYDQHERDMKELIQHKAVTIEIPSEFNTIGIIDGQHRVFAYHEGDDNYEAKIAIKRSKHLLLATGLIYPSEMTDDDRREFEAKIFLEINDKQTRTRSELRQAIEAIVNPFSKLAIARTVIEKLANNGPLCGRIAEHEFDRGKLKSSSIVSYGLNHVVKCEGNDSLFQLWQHPQKELFRDSVFAASEELKTKPRVSRNTLIDYIEFCARKTNDILIAFKRVMDRKCLWVEDKKTSRAITTTSINGVIHCLRAVIENKKTGDQEYYFKALQKMSIDFSATGFKFKSSHWRDLGLQIYEQCFR